MFLLMLASPRGIIQATWGPFCCVDWKALDIRTKPPSRQIARMENHAISGV